MVDDSAIKKGLVFAIVVVVFILSFFIIKPIIFPIIFGVLFAYIFNPVYLFINKYVKIKTLSATILMILIVVIIALPILYWTPKIVGQTFGVFSLLQNYDFSKLFNNFLSRELADSLSVSLDNMISKFFSSFLDQFKNIFFNLPSLLLQFAVFLFTFFFVIRDSTQLKNYLSSLSPFSASTEEKFLNEFRGITNAIIIGQVLVGVIQGLALGIALFILGVPHALILTILASIISIIPFLGPVLVWLPVGVILLATGKTFEGTFILLYGAIFVSSIDNVLRPYILSKRSTLSIPVSIIGTVGGLYMFGIAGLILGPLILAYALIIIEFYREGKLNELFRK